MAEETADTSPGAWWHKIVAVAAVGLASSVGTFMTSHWGGVTTAQLKVVKDDIAAVASKQQSGDEVNARNHAETKAQIGAVDAKVDKLSAAVLGKKKKRSDAQP